MSHRITRRRFVQSSALLAAVGPYAASRMAGAAAPANERITLGFIGVGKQARGHVGRFLGMLDSFLEYTQFVVVTHNKGTMAASDMLYGITMETKGVSCRVAVELSDVDAFVPEAIGDAAKAAEARESREPVVELIPKARRGAVEPEPDDEPLRPLELRPAEPAAVVAVEAAAGAATTEGASATDRG